MSLNAFDHRRASGLPIPSPPPVRARVPPMRSVGELCGAVAVPSEERVPANYEPRRVRQYQETNRHG